MDRAVVHVEGDNTAATTFIVHDQVDREIFDVELGRVAQRLPVHRVQHGMAGAVGRRASALGGAFAEMCRHPAERALIDFSVFLATRKRQPPMLKLVNSSWRVAAEIFNGVLVAEPVGALDCVVHMPTPVVFAHVAKCSGNAALRGNRVRARRENFGDARGA